MPKILQAAATPNNQFLVWDRLTGAWVGVWEGPALEAAHLFPWRDGDTERGAVVNSDGTVRQVLVDGCWDDDGAHPGMVFETAIDLGDTPVRPSEVELTMEHHHGAWATFLAADGVDEMSGPHKAVPDPEDFLTFATGAYDVQNADDNQTAQHREDYAVVVGAGDNASTPAGGVYVSTAKGLFVGIRQTWTQRMRMRKAARSLWVRIETMRGYQAVRKIAARVVVGAWGRGGKS